MSQLSRREFAALAAVAAVAPFATSRRSSAARALTAQDVVDRIKENIGVEWKPETLDTIKAGDAAATVTGIVTTSLASLAVLQQAVKTGANFVITTHPTFYSRSDGKTPPAGRGGALAGPDAVFAAKDDFITKNKLIVFRLTDHWRLRQPNPAAVALADALGWSKAIATTPATFEIPAVSLETLAATVTKRLDVRGGIRVVGDKQLRVQRVGLLPGSTPLAAALALLPNVDAIVAGEVREWESVEYARDKVDGGEKKALVLIGRIVSEDAGMKACAAWLKSFMPEVPIRHISAGDPYWRPA
jgi:putative NIF3 family GTP cyclohydrolase 1 type 2